jgi:hypothetical protein
MIFIAKRVGVFEPDVDKKQLSEKNGKNLFY